MDGLWRWVYLPTAFYSLDAACLGNGRHRLDRYSGIALIRADVAITWLVASCKAFVLCNWHDSGKKLTYQFIIVYWNEKVSWMHAAASVHISRPPVNCTKICNAMEAPKQDSMTPWWKGTKYDFPKKTPAWFADGIPWDTFQEGKPPMVYDPPQWLGRSSG